MMWVVIGHTHYTAFFSPSINALDATEVSNIFNIFKHYVRISKRLDG